MGSLAPEDKKASMQIIIVGSLEKEIEKRSVQLKQAVQVAVKDCIEKNIDKRLLLEEYEEVKVAFFLQYSSFSNYHSAKFKIEG